MFYDEEERTCGEKLKSLGRLDALGCTRSSWFSAWHFPMDYELCSWLKLLNLRKTLFSSISLIHFRSQIQSLMDYILRTQPHVSPPNILIPQHSTPPLTHPPKPSNSDPAISYHLIHRRREKKKRKDRPTDSNHASSSNTSHDALPLISKKKVKIKIKPPNSNKTGQGSSRKKKRSFWNLDHGIQSSSVQ